MTQKQVTVGITVLLVALFWYFSITSIIHLWDGNITNWGRSYLSTVIILSILEGAFSLGKKL